MSFFRHRWRRGRIFSPQNYFNVPLYDLKDDSPIYAGIHAPVPERGAPKVGITDQFLQNAQEYHSRYLNTDHYQAAFAKGLAAAHFRPQDQMDILDIGTGSGVNSVVPCARIFNAPRIIATDLSPDLLLILQKFLSRGSLSANVACICMDSSNDFFKPGCFDIVSGAAILHHLMDPTTALKSAYRALRPGGVALFFEPFEAGHLTLCTTYRQIISLSGRLGGVGPEAEKVLRDMILAWTTCVGTDKSAPHFPHMDDKWIFTRSYIRQAAREIGFSEPIIVPQYEHGQPEGSFAGMTRTILRLHSNLPPQRLPDWSWEMLQELDHTMTQEMRDDLLLEGIIALRKP